MSMLLQGLRTVREIEQSDGVLRLCEMVIRIRDVGGAQKPNPFV